jgi:hypothetical protein
MAANQPFLTEDTVSVYSLTDVAKNVGASHLMFVLVDRSTSKWIKVSVMCYEPDGGLLWREKSQAGGGVTSKGQIEKALKQQGEAIARQDWRIPASGEIGSVTTLWAAEKRTRCAAIRDRMADGSEGPCYTKLPDGAAGTVSSVVQFAPAPARPRRWQGSRHARVNATRLGCRIRAYGGVNTGASIKYP